MRWFRRKPTCVHWFDPPYRREYSRSGGHVVCCQQRTYTVTEEVRTCHLCGFVQVRPISEVYEGWQ